jgi:soluble lytic murein transglycosylase-like protein
MNFRAKSLMAILLTVPVLVFGVTLSCVPARAQIVSVLDQHGQRVYINTAPIPPRATASAKNGAGSLNATKANQSASGLSAASPAVAAGGTNEISTSGALHVLSSARLEELVQSTAARHGVDANLVRAVIETESGGNPSAVSRKGAVGLMQLMPTTALELGVRNMYSASENLEGGVRYLHTLLNRYGGDLDKALAAYNAGAGAVDRAGGVPRYRETREYVKKVTSNYRAADGGRSMSAPHSGLSGTPAAPKAATVAVPPPNKIFKTTDGSGHVVWAN